MPPPLLDSRGASLLLGRELGRGGEGIVYDIPSQPNSVAKIYLKVPDRDLVAKIIAMVTMANDRLLRLAAWPTGTIYARDGHLMGFIMPKVSGFRPAFELYGPKLRLQRFPKADWRFLIQAAANAARAFSVVHAAGHIIGDVNHGNLVVGQDATVRLIDCDSFQISASSRIWFCEVGVTTHQPPEMQGLKSYADFWRTNNHDNFGLAVIIFQMLCLARHPYSGRYLPLGNAPAIEDCIKDFRYAYATNMHETGMAPPPGSLAVSALTPRLREQFERAFLAAGARPGGRPTPDQWVQALAELAGQLRQCRINQAHFHLSSLAQCPWCDIERQSGSVLFPIIFVSSRTGRGSFAVLWQQVTAIPEPAAPPEFPTRPTAKPSIEAVRVGRRMWTEGAALAFALTTACGVWIARAPQGVGWIAISISVIVVLLLYAVELQLPRVARYRTELRKSEGEWKALQNRHRDETYRARFRASRAEADALKRSHDVLMQERTDRLRMLHENRRQSQLKDHLDRFQIASARVRGVGPAKAAVLQSYGIETALDIDPNRIISISGFGPKTVANLLAWRRSCEQRFRFDAAKSVSSSEIAAIERDVALQRRTLEAKMAKLLDDLQAHAVSEQQRHTDCISKLVDIGPAYAQARANLPAAKGVI